MTRRTLFVCGEILMAALILFGLQGANMADAATITFTVNSPSDANDLDFPGGKFDGSSDGRCDADTAAGKQCTLRAAIQTANKHSGSDIIAFGLPGSGVHIISPTSPLPAITRRVTVDGYTQLDARPNTHQGNINAVLMIELESHAGEVPGLELKGDGASNSVIRGLVINGFSSGIKLTSGTGYKIQGNFIGTDPTGTTARGNNTGVYVSAGASTIGGALPAAHNLISGNGILGVFLHQARGNNKVEGNLIGTTADGGSALRNGLYGVEILSSNNTIGDSNPSDGLRNAANTIAYNGRDGIGVVGDFGGTGNRILSNTINLNRYLAIDLQGSPEDVFGVTANDVDHQSTPNPDPDADTGPNRLQNYPVITSAQIFHDPLLGTTTNIGATLESTPSTADKKRTFIIQFFGNKQGAPGPDPSGYGEGSSFLGQTQVTTDRQGKATTSFSTTSPAALTGDYITATATNKGTGDTSEFSKAEPVEEPVIGGPGIN